MTTTTRRAAAVVAVLLAGSLALAGCNRGSKASTGAPTAQSDVKIAMVVRDFSNPYWTAMRTGAQDEAKALGVTVNVQAGASETDTNGIANKITTLGSQDYNCFGVVPNSTTNLITPLLPVAKKKLPIINLDTHVDYSAASKAGVTFTSFIGSDNEEAGKLDGQRMVKLLGTSGGKVAMLQGLAGESNGQNREKGFREAISGSKVTLVAVQPADYEQAKAQTVMDAILKQHSDLKGIFTANDTMALGAAQSVANAGLKGKVKILSVDGISPALNAIKQGTISGTVTQYPYAEGLMAVQACVAIAKGKQVPENVVSPITLIDSTNVAQAVKNYPKPFKPYDNPFPALIK